jgi:hypothetical protein
MPLAALYNVPNSPESLSQWSFANADHHRNILTAIYDTYGTTLPEYVLDPINPSTMSLWLQQHGTMHLNQNEILGIASNELFEVDWNDPEELGTWLELHASEHLRAAQILGVE